jgi:hypothetical protein
LEAITESLPAPPPGIDLDAVVKDPIEAWKWNLQRSDDNISAFYSEQYHREWLIDAAAETKHIELGTNYLSRIESVLKRVDLNNAHAIDAQP